MAESKRGRDGSGRERKCQRRKWQRAEAAETEVAESGKRVSSRSGEALIDDGNNIKNRGLRTFFMFVITLESLWSSSICDLFQEKE